MFLFKKRETPAECIRKWKRLTSHDERALVSSIHQMQRDERIIIKEMKRHARTAPHLVKEGARSLIQQRAYIKKTYMQKALLGSLTRILDDALAIYCMSSAIFKMVGVMRLMNRLVSVPLLAHTMTQMQREMTVMEMTSDVIEDIIEEEEEEEETTETIDTILEEFALKIPISVHHEAVHARVTPQPAIQRAQPTHSEDCH